MGLPGSHPHPPAIDPDDPRVYEQMFDNALVGICFMHRRRFLRVNARMEEMLGYAPGALVGESVRTVYARQQDFDEVGEVIAAFPAGNRYIHERPLVTRDGSLLWCLIAGRLIDPQDPDSASVWVVQDMSASRRTEDELARANQRLEQTVLSRTRNLQKSNAALKLEVERRREFERAMIESREKYRVLIRNIPLGIAITDAGGEVIEINPALQDLFGVADVDGFADFARRNTVVVVGDGRTLGFDQVLHVCAPTLTRRVEHLNIRWQAQDRPARWFDVIGVRVPVRDLGSAVLFLDRSEQRRAREREHDQQQQLAHATRLSMMGQLASALAHELGQPLNACISYASGIEHRLGATLQQRPDAQDALTRIQLHLHQAGEVIRNVRAFIASHRPDNEPIDLSVLARSTLDLLQFQLRESGVPVQLHLDPALPILHGTRVELQQVLVNLIVNAVESLRHARVARPQVHLRIRRQPRMRVGIQVSDNGPGVPEHLRDTIFQPYTTTKHGGLGMGLTMCRTIVESHGGELRLDADRRRGASFRVVLPVEPVPA